MADLDFAAKARAFAEASLNADEVMPERMLVEGPAGTHINDFTNAPLSEMGDWAQVNHLGETCCEQGAIRAAFINQGWRLPAERRIADLPIDQHAQREEVVIVHIAEQPPALAVRWDPVLTAHIALIDRTPDGATLRWLDPAPMAGGAVAMGLSAGLRTAHMGKGWPK